jgi:hypothetical protein
MKLSIYTVLEQIDLQKKIGKAVNEHLEVTSYLQIPSHLNLPTT